VRRYVARAPLSTLFCVVLTMRKWHICSIGVSLIAMLTGISSPTPACLSPAATATLDTVLAVNDAEWCHHAVSIWTVLSAELKSMDWSVARNTEVGRNASLESWPATM